MDIRFRSALPILLAASLTTANAQRRAGQYMQAGIERGSRLYGANCSVCPISIFAAANSAR
jgi:mono/diheme cytochrome c family protein